MPRNPYTPPFLLPAREGVQVSPLPRSVASKDASKRNMAGKPLTANQAPLYELIKSRPGLRAKDYVLLLYRVNTDYTRRKVSAALKGCFARGLIHFYIGCTCCPTQKPLKKKGHSYKCPDCKAMYAEVYVRADRIGLCNFRPV